MGIGDYEFLTSPFQLNRTDGLTFYSPRFKPWAIKGLNETFALFNL
jgi:hypothetical protein